MKKTTTLTIEVEYDDQKTHPEGLAQAMDALLKTALSDPGVMGEYGNPKFDEFFLPGAKAVVLPKDFAESERGNTWLSNDGGDHATWIRLGGNLFLEATITLGNYPGFCLAVIEKTEKQIARHISKNLKGWFVHKCNIKGVRIGKDGEVE